MSEERNEELFALLKGFDMAMACDPEEVSKRNQTLYLPKITNSTFQQLFDSVRNQLYAETPVHHIEAPCVVFGDLHGHFLDLIRIMKKFGYPVNRKFVFLGDIIDRENVIILRGNHEFPNVFYIHGFNEDARDYSLSQSAVTSMIKTLEYLPFACIIGNKYICMHGGIGPSVTYEGIKDIKLPCETFDGFDIVKDIVWSDPTTDVSGYKKSPRGKGHLFGKDALNDFLDKNGFSCLIRAHEKAMGGVESLFDGKLLTVFSASNYCGDYENYGGAIAIYEDLEYEITKFEPLTYLLRCHTLKVDEFFHKKIEDDPLLKFNRSLQKETNGKPTRRSSDPFRNEQSNRCIPSIILNKIRTKPNGSSGVPPTIKFSSAKMQREQKENQIHGYPK